MVDIEDDDGGGRAHRALPVLVEDGAAVEQAGERIGDRLEPVAGGQTPLVQRQRQRADPGHAGDADGKTQILGPVAGRCAQHQLAVGNQHGGTEHEGDRRGGIECGNAEDRCRRLGAGEPILPGGGKEHERDGKIV